MKKSSKLILIFCLIAIFALIFIFWKKAKNSGFQGVSQSTEEQNSNQNFDISVRYENTEFGFSFIKPVGYTIAELDQGDGKVILIQDKDGKGFQILLSSFDEANTSITKTRILKDIPGMKIINDKQISIDSVDGLEFQSNNVSFEGQSSEIWFVHSGHLYQLSGYNDSLSIMEQVIQSLKFN